ncbi:MULTISPECIES: LamG-like jellyroll fold domain-containing protein [Dehalobacter]|uniref:phage head spike fiber domain-containing protein n=1 Tax=Dehalobacter TaxID=56112 RepID=UPI00258BF53F|nr:LamG-like jellyroll fold domain-containing protein [Dehalobacter sp.]MDJ0305402.1 hypothetical protein [Dehalobacter sp.]
MITPKSKRPVPNIYPASLTRAGFGLNLSGKIFPQNTPRMEFGQLIKNAISTGDFETSTTGWVLNTGVVSTDYAYKGTKSLKFANVAYSSGARIDVPFPDGHKIYCRTMLYLSAYTSGTAYLNIYDYNDWTNPVGKSASSITGVWQTLSVIKTTVAGKGGIRFVFDHSNVTDTEYWDCAVMVDLTALGLDNLTLAQCDAKFANANGGILIQPANPVWVEESTTNLLSKPLDFSNAIWAKVTNTIVQGGQIDPFGGDKAWLVTDPDNTRNCYITQQISVPNDSVQRVGSVYVKQGSYAKTQLYLSYTGGTVLTTDIVITWGTTPTIYATAGVTPTLTAVGNGWYKVTAVLANNNAGNTYLTLGLYGAEWVSGGTAIGSSYFAFPQLETKAYATNFVDGTRNAEVYSITTPGGLTPASGCIRMWVYFNPASRRNIANNHTRIFSVNRLIGGTGLAISHDQASNWYIAGKNDAGTDMAYVSVPDSNTPEGWHLICLKWSTAEVKFFIDAVLKATIVNPALPSAFDSVITFAGHASQVAYALGSMIDEIHISNDYPSDAALLNEYLNNYPAVPERQSTNICPTDVSGWEQGTLGTTTGEPATSASRIRTVGFIEVLPNTQYTYSVTSNLHASSSFFFYASDGSYISYTSSPEGAMSKTITTPSNCTKVKLLSAKSNGSDAIVPSEVPVIKAQLETGATPTSWMAGGTTRQVALIRPKVRYISQGII